MEVGDGSEDEYDITEHKSESNEDEEHQVSYLIYLNQIIQINFYLY